MNRIAFLAVLAALLLGCTTHPPHTAVIPTADNSPPHTAADISRKYPAPLEKVVEACKSAIRDIGADYFKPKIEIKVGSATITSGTKTCLYGIILIVHDGFTEVMLFLDDKSTKDVIRKSVFDEFWSAVEAHL